MPKRLKKTVTMVMKKSGARRRYPFVEIEIKANEYVITTSKAYGVYSSKIFPKSIWQMESEPLIKKRRVQEPVEETVAVSEPEPPESPDPPDEKDEDGYSEADMALINGQDKRVSGSVTGDLTKEYPGEYNTKVAHDKIGMKDLMKMKAHVESNYALAEGERKFKQAKARKMLLAQAENLGSGWIPD